MAKKLLSFKTKGMNKDLSVSAFNPEFSFENMNLRLSTNEGNTLMSWVNEKGTRNMTLHIDLNYWDPREGYTSLVIKGVPIGTAIINHLLVIFTTVVGYPNNLDRIYVLHTSDKPNILEGLLLFMGNLNFSVKNPIETLVSYESDIVLKVYWTDGLNQPRVINIAASVDKIKKWNTLFNNSVATCFDFVPALNGSELVTIEKHTSSGGIFAPGVIQYALSYVNVYGLQSNLFYVSPLYYLSPHDRGASPEEKVTASFTIKVTNVDLKFDYLRIYSIQRTSLNLEPIVKLLDTLATTSDILEYTDSGNTGALMDPTELLFIGGKEISALTMADKDLTLFLGNIVEKNSNVKAILDYYDDLRNPDKGGNDEATMGIEFKNDGDCKKFTLDRSLSIYSHTNTLNYESRNITTFKGGETYRFGFQLQKKTGEWSEPIFMNDVKNDFYPKTSIYENLLNLVHALAEIPISELASRITGFYSIYQRIRPVVVFPTIGDRTVLCQGVLNPTVFNVKDRKDSSPYALASWYFRPYMFYGEGEDSLSLLTMGDAISPIEHITRANRDGQISYDSHLPMKDCYILVASVSVDKLDYLKSRKYINITHGGAHFTHSFFAIIKLDPVYVNNTVIPNKDHINGYSYYAFLSDGGWPGRNMNGIKEFDAYNEIPAFEYEFLYNMLSDADPYKIYRDLVSIPNTLGLRYVIPENVTDAPSNYTFSFEAGDFKYGVSFNATNTDYEVMEYEDTGQGVEYKHYSSLYTQLDYETVATLESSSNNDKIAAAKRIEIQGSVKSYNKAYDAEVKPTLNNNVESNTLFFVDLSIVTLNSPDIEFDTEVLAFGTEGLYMRVVGVVPITANASSHLIAHTAMLEKMVNDNAIFGKGELDVDIIHNNINPYAGKRLVSEFLWHDNFVKLTDQSDADGNKKWESVDLRTFLIYPWHRKGSLNNDTRSETYASSYLLWKKESNILYSINSGYLPLDLIVPFTKVGMLMILTENAEVMNYRLPKQDENSMDVNYYPNIDKVLYSNVAYHPIVIDTNGNISSTVLSNTTDFNSPVSIKYLSTSHAVLDFMAGSTDKIPILPAVECDVTTPGYQINMVSRGVFEYANADVEEGTSQQDISIKPYWGNDDTTLKFKLRRIDVTSLFNYNDKVRPLNLLWLGELYKDVLNRFGGKGKEALRSNNWLVGGDAVNISQNDSNITLYWTLGDTYYQRYDCLKTYAMTDIDNNQLVEILSFMCETHTNIDGRYDRNRGLIDNTNMRPQNFNLLNPVYSQQDNFFTSKKVLTEEQLPYVHPNYVTWSKTKESGADVDLWTNMTLASVMELDGDKGKISKLSRLNDTLLAFQDTGISQILYNENVQISSTAGVPIEIANSGKVQGKRYLSDTIGCSNKWSVCLTPSGIYFIDSHDKGIYLFNGQLLNLSVAGGFNSWSKQNITLTDNGWNPWDFNDFVTYYDKQNKDVLFINSETALAYNENLSAFTSLYSYQDTAYLCNLDDRGFWIKADSADESFIWGHLEGDYCTFFGDLYPYWMTLVGNPEPLVDKIFTNLEFRANVDTEGTTNTAFTPYLPFDNLEVWNEYQHGITDLENKHGHSAMVHHSSDMTSALKRKFRIWRCDIPRDNYPLSGSEDVDVEKGIYRYSRKPMDRIRNPWAYLKLLKEENTNKRVEIHDVTMTYFS